MILDSPITRFVRTSAIDANFTPFLRFVKAVAKFRPILSVSLFSVAFLFAEGESHAQYFWTRNTAGTYNWSDSANWVGSTPPPAIATGSVNFGPSPAGPTVTTNQTIKLSSTQTFQGGFYVRNRSIGTLTFDLQANGMVFDGAVVEFGWDRTASGNAAVFTGTTGSYLQFGTSSNATDLLVFSSPSNDGGRTSVNTANVVVNSGVKFDSVNLNNLLVGGAPANVGVVTVFDLSGATLKSGAINNELKVKGDFKIGHYSGSSVTSGSQSSGTVLLPASTAGVTVGGDLILGMLSSNPTGNNRTFTSGTLNFGGGSASRLQVDGDLVVGRGDAASGVITNLPSSLDLKVGVDSSTRSAIYIGYRDKNVAGTGLLNSERHVSGSVATQGGTFNAYLTSFHVGQNLNLTGTGSAVGTFDMSSATLGTLDVSGAVVIGAGTDAQGTVKLKGGDATALSVSVGNATGTPGRSLLSLDSTVFEMQSLSLGGFGDILVTIGYESAGIDLTSSLSANFSIASGGVLNIAFTEEVTSDVWGLRMQGDMSSLFESYLSNGRLVASGLYGDQAEVFFDGTHTYFGIAGAIPEPSAIMLLFGGGVAFFGLRRWNRVRA